MSKEIARNRRAKKQRAILQKRGLLRVTVLKSNNHISAQLVDSSNGNRRDACSTLLRSIAY